MPGPVWASVEETLNVFFLSVFLKEDDFDLLTATSKHASVIENWSTKLVHNNTQFSKTTVLKKLNAGMS